ncbi:Detected protein of unknown function [Hibiscus syriacus]|uniref:SANTA domain-containing protein n=1 Tax=Hibiscus syriacus TaxID=106335 RepID=A0A6A3BXJ7_HIBSY|nr:Detected protein of unknown function [Hibiscus syriacus]
MTIEMNQRLLQLEVTSSDVIVTNLLGHSARTEEESPGLPLDREVKFQIEIMSGIAPIAMEPYRMASKELQKSRRKMVQCVSALIVGSSIRLVIPDDDELKNDLLTEGHCSPLTIHPGGKNVYGSQESILVAGLLQPTSIPQWKWENMTMDFVTELPLTPNKRDSIWMIMDRLTKPAYFIPLRVDFSMDNYQSSIKMAPYEALYERKCRTPLNWYELKNREVLGPELIQEVEEKVQVIQNNLKEATDRQKSSDLWARSIGIASFSTDTSKVSIPKLGIDTTAREVSVPYLGYQKAGGSELGVAKTAYFYEQIRSEYSTTIAKRHDATTLETADGIMVAISGIINTSRTLENGFSPKVCSHFLFGFPYDWEEYASPSEESVCHSAISSLPPSLDKLPFPAARMGDLLMFSAGDSQKLVSDHMLQKLSSHDSQNAVITVDSNTGNKQPELRPYSAVDGENSNCQKKVKVIRNDNNTLCSRSKTKVEPKKENQSRIGVGSITRAIGVKTRSMIRLKQKELVFVHHTPKRKELHGKSTQNEHELIAHSAESIELLKEELYDAILRNENSDSPSHTSIPVSKKRPKLEICRAQTHASQVLSNDSDQIMAVEIDSDFFSNRDAAVWNNIVVEERDSELFHTKVVETTTASEEVRSASTLHSQPKEVELTPVSDSVAKKSVVAGSKNRQCIAFIESKGRKCVRWANEGDVYCCVHLASRFTGTSSKIEGTPLLTHQCVKYLPFSRAHTKRKHLETTSCRDMVLVGDSESPLQVEPVSIIEPHVAQRRNSLIKKLEHSGSSKIWSRSMEAAEAVELVHGCVSEIIRSKKKALEKAKAKSVVAVGCGEDLHSRLLLAGHEEEALRDRKHQSAEKMMVKEVASMLNNGRKGFDFETLKEMNCDKATVIRNYKSFDVVSNPNFLGVRSRTSHIVESEAQLPHLALSYYDSPEWDFDRKVYL